MVKNQSYGSYKPPKDPSRHPLTRRDTEKMYKTACEYPDREAEVTVRTLLDYGLRAAEMAHITEEWIQKEYNRRTGRELWRINIPKYETCHNGSDSGTYQNKSGQNLHDTDSNCSNCKDRKHKRKVAPKVNGERRPDQGWLPKDKAEKYGFHPKNARSATKTWEFPNVPETAETAKLLKQFLKGQKYQQYPHTQSTVRTKVAQVAEAADLTLPDRPREAGVVPHGLRHTYGCRLVEMQLGEGAAMKQMRHQDANVFEWYADVRDTRVVNALAEASSEADSLLHNE